MGVFFYGTFLEAKHLDWGRGGLFGGQVRIYFEEILADGFKYLVVVQPDVWGRFTYF